MEERCSLLVVTQTKFGQRVTIFVSFRFQYYNNAFSFQDFARYGFGHQAQETEVYLSFKEAAKGATKG